MKYTEAEFNKLSEKERLNNTLEGTFNYAWLTKPKISERFKTIKFTMNLIVDETNKKKALDMGLKVNPPDKYNPGEWVEISRKIKDIALADEKKPEIVDSMQNPFPTNIMIGNNSKGIVKFGRYWYPNNGGGVGTVLFKVQVRELVEFKPMDTSLVMDQSGFTVDPAKVATAAEDGFKDPAEFDV